MVSDACCDLMTTLFLFRAPGLSSAGEHVAAKLKELSERTAALDLGGRKLTTTMRVVPCAASDNCSRHRWDRDQSRTNFVGLVVVDGLVRAYRQSR